jgi:peroxiredoxin/outer membrane lipoprotein-sorting protein
MRLLFVLLSLFLCLPAGATPQEASGDSATDLVRRVASRYTFLENFHFEGSLTMTTRMMGMEQSLDGRVVMAGSSAGRRLFRLVHDVVGMTVVSDGEYTWTWMSMGNQYTRQSAIPIGRGGDRGSVQPAGNLLEEGAFLSSYANLDIKSLTPSIVGREVIRSGDRDVECEVVRVTHVNPPELESVMGPDTFWVDAERALVVRSRELYRGTTQGHEVTVRTAIDFDTMIHDQAPPDSMFVFVPPEGAREVERFGPAGIPAADMTGKYAPEFALPGLNGRTHRLADFRGQVVLIDFWATWCRPCRAELPVIEGLYRRYRERGLVVMAITTEKEKVAASFIRKNDYTFPVLIDQESDAYDKYRVNSIPVVVIVGRDGKIAAHFVGLRDEEELVEAIKRAGIQ